MTVNAITIDTETMDVTTTALILSIGAFAFDVTDLNTTQQAIMDVSNDIELQDNSKFAFYRCVDSFDQLMSGRTVSPSTQKWWHEQGEEAHEALTGQRLSLGESLSDLKRWIATHPDARIFFRGTDFDGSILENAYRAAGITCPWKYNGKRDIRTYIDAMVRGGKGYIKDHQPCFPMIKHNALHDAMGDAEQMATAYMMNDGNTVPSSEFKKVTA
ncbi:3'-5' exonuclease [Rouxiella sp. WC2420]|uniref:3'-5' exonuclease n=1 Tax=Rouxiella sp. WC2420 TaxID=3234145 RepID=A0AB39VMU6_9GAMM